MPPPGGLFDRGGGGRPDPWVFKKPVQPPAFRRARRPWSPMPRCRPPRGRQPIPTKHPTRQVKGCEVVGGFCQVIIFPLEGGGRQSLQFALTYAGWEIGRAKFGCEKIGNKKTPIFKGFVPKLYSFFVITALVMERFLYTWPGNIPQFSHMSEGFVPNFFP